MCVQRIVGTIGNLGVRPGIASAIGNCPVRLPERLDSPRPAPQIGDAAVDKDDRVPAPGLAGREIGAVGRHHSSVLEPSFHDAS